MRVAIQTETRNRIGFSVLPYLMKATVGPVYSQCNELWIAANRVFLLCLTYCGHRLIADSCLSLESQCSSAAVFFSSLSPYCSAGASIAWCRRGRLGLCPSDLPWGLNPRVPPCCCMMHEGQTLEGGAGSLITLWFIFNEVNRSFQVTCKLTHTHGVWCVFPIGCLIAAPLWHPPWLQGLHSIIRSHCHWQNVSHFPQSPFPFLQVGCHQLYCGKKTLL